MTSEKGATLSFLDYRRTITDYRSSRTKEDGRGRTGTRLGSIECQRGATLILWQGSPSIMASGLHQISDMFLKAKKYLNIKFKLIH